MWVIDALVSCFKNTSSDAQEKERRHSC